MWFEDRRAKATRSLRGRTRDWSWLISSSLHALLYEAREGAALFSRERATTSLRQYFGAASGDDNRSRPPFAGATVSWRRGDEGFSAAVSPKEEFGSSRVRSSPVVPRTEEERPL